MAAAGARFSIREYADRARAAGGSWPFGGDAGALPPMEVRRFRWWADEAAAVEEEEGEVERRMATKRRKRSVAELFAAVPRVARGQGKRVAVNGVPAKKGKLVLADEVKASKGFKKKVAPIGTAVSKKEKSGSIKATSVSFSPLFQDQDFTRKRKLTKSIGKKKGSQEVSVLPDKTGKGKKKSFLDNKNATKNIVQAQSILNKQSKVRFSRVPDSTNVMCKTNSSCKPKHVTFSHDVFGWTVPEQPQSEPKSQRPSKESLDQRSGDELQSVYQTAHRLAGATEEDSSSLSEIVVSTGVCCTFPVAKPKEGPAVSNSMDRNHCTEISNSTNYFNSNSLAYLSSKMPSQNLDGVYSHLDHNAHLDNNEDISLDTECIREENHVILQEPSYPVSLAVKAIYGDYRSALSQPSNSGLDDRRRSTLTDRMITDHHLSKFHHRFIRSDKDVRTSIRSSVRSMKPSDAQATDCAPAGRSKYLSNDYVRLPLNSRGEFVKLHPDGTPSSINIPQMHCLGESSSRPMTCADHVNLKPSHHVPKTYTEDQSPHFTPTATTEYEMDFRRLPCPERMETHKYTVPSNKCPCTNQQELSAVCFCSKHMECHNPQRKLFGMQSCFMHQDCKQNTLPTAEPTMRLMGKTVTLGTSSIQCRDLNNDSPGSSKQTQDDCSFQGTCRKAFPQMFHWEMLDPPSAFRIPHGEREPSGNLSYLSFAPAAELRSELDTNSFRPNGYNQQPKPTAANSPYVRPVTWCNEGVLQHQHPVMPNQVQSHAEDMLLVSMQHRNTPIVASGPCFNRKNSVRNSMEKRQAPYQPGYFTQKFNSMAQRNPISSSLSGYAAVQSTPGSTTKTKFTSLPPLPPSLEPSHVNSLDYAQHRGSNAITFDPSIPAIYQASKSSAPANDVSRDERLKWAMMGSNVEGSGHMNGNGKRPAEKDDALLTSPKKPCTAAQKDINLSPAPQQGLQFCGSRPNAQPVAMPVGFRPEPRLDLQLGNREARATWTLNSVAPVKLKPGARHILQPNASNNGQDMLWTVNSVTPFSMENAACTSSTSKNGDT